MDSVADQSLSGPWLVKQAVILICILIGAGCGREQSDRFPEEVRTNYVSSCIRSGSDRQFCECTLEVMENMLSYREFQKLETGMLSGNEAAIDELSDVMREASSQCESERSTDAER